MNTTPFTTPSASPPTCTAFLGSARLAQGPRHELIRTLRTRQPLPDEPLLLVFDDQTGKVVDLDLRDGAPDAPADDAFAQGLAPGGEGLPRGRGRPRLGVVAKEVTLLPRHWDWLSAQPGGASVALRKLVEAALRDRDGTRTRRQCQDACYAFISAMAGNEPGFEEATRALYAGDRPRFEQETAGWPVDVRDHARHLAQGAFG